MFYSDRLTVRALFISLWSSATLPQTLGVCSRECIRGLCLNVSQDVGVSEVCECGLFYEGEACESVMLDTPTKAVGPTYISFTWNRDPYAGNIPNLHNFVFFVYPRGSQNVKNDYETTEPLYDLKNDGQVTLPGLTSGGTAYVVCFIHNSTNFDGLSNSALRDLTEEKRKSCLSFRTGYDVNDPYTRAAIWVAVAMSITLVLIFVAGLVEACNRRSLGKRIRRSLRASWKEMFLERYAQSKERVARAQAGGRDGGLETKNPALAPAIGDDPEGGQSDNAFMY